MSPVPAEAPTLRPPSLLPVGTCCFSTNSQPNPSDPGGFSQEDPKEDLNPLVFPPCSLPERRCLFPSLTLEKKQFYCPEVSDRGPILILTIDAGRDPHALVLGPFLWHLTTPTSPLTSACPLGQRGLDRCCQPAPIALGGDSSSSTRPRHCS